MVAGALNFVISADASQARKELIGLQRESQFAAEAVRTIFSQDTIRGAGIQVLSASTISLVEQLSSANGQLQLANVLVGSLKNGVQSLLALPIPDFQEQAFAALGFEQAGQIVQILSLAGTALKAFAIPVGIASAAVTSLSGAFERIAVKLQIFAYSLSDLAAELRATGGAFAPLADLIDASSRAVERFSDSARNSRDGLDSLWLSIGRLDERLQRYIDTSETFQSALSDLGDAAILFNSFSAINDIADQFLGGIDTVFNSAASAETLANRLELVSTAAGGASDDLAFLQSTTKELGLNFSSAAEGFASFSVAANLAGISSDQTRSIFEGISQSTVAMGLSAAETQGVFLALQQSLSSGNVQLEEVNQLAERIPGTFQAASAALGVTTREFKALVSAGNIQSVDFIPAFVQQLELLTESGVVDGMNSGAAAVNRFTNALGSFRVAAGQAWLQVGVPALNAFAAALEFAAKNEQLFSTAIDAILVASLPFFVAGLGKATLALIKFFAANQTAQITIFGQQLAIAASQITKLAASAGIAYVGLLVLYEIVEQLKDSATSTREAIASLDRSLADLKGNSGAVSELLPERPPATGWLDTPITKLREIQKEGNIAERVLVDMFANIATGGLFHINKLVTYWKTGSFEISTAGQNALDEQLIAVGDFAARAQEILGQSLEFRSQASAGSGALQELKNIEAALKQVEDARLKQDPADADAIAALAAQEAELLKRRGDAQKEVLDLQGALNNALTQAQQELQNLDPSKLGTEGYEQVREQLQAQINLLEREQQAFLKLTNVAKVTAESITDAFKKSSQSLDTAYANTQAQIEESISSGTATQEQAQQQRIEAERQFLEDRLKLNRETEAKLRAELERNTKLRAIDPSKATLSTKQEEEYKAQLEKIELDIAKTRIDLAKSTQQERQRLTEQELDNIRSQQEQANAILQRTENNRIAAIRQRQSTGALSEEVANQQIEEIQQDSINVQIAQEQDKLKQIESLRARGVLSVQEAADQESEILGRLSDLNLQRIERELQARQEANQQIIKDFEASIRSADEAIKRSQNSRKQALAEAQLSGASNEDSARRAAEIEQDAIAETLALRERELAAVTQLRARGVLSVKEAADREAQIISQLGDLKLRQIEGEIAAQQGLLQSLSTASTDSSSEVERQQAERLAAIREAQAQGLTNERDAARQSAQLQRDAAAEAVRIKQDELAQVSQLRQNGSLTIEEAADREQQLILEIANARQSAAQAELSLREQVASAIEAEADLRIETNQRATELTESLNQRQIQSLNNQNSLLSAQLGLLEAQASLRQQRLESAIKEAEASGRTGEVERLRKQLLDDQIKVQEQQAQIAREQLQLQQQQNALELENQRIQAETAVIEAQINIEKARASEASLQEIANLERILGLRNNQLAAINSQATAQQRINSLEEQALRIQQQRTREALQQQRMQARVNPGSGGSAGSGGQSNSGSSGGLATSASVLPVVTQITDKLTDLARGGSLADAFNIANLKLNLKTGFTGVEDLGSRLGAGSNGDILGKLDQLIAATKEGAGRPNLSISNVNDLGLAGQIYADISRSGLRGASL